jgi:hypothetical protein
MDRGWRKEEPGNPGIPMEQVIRTVVRWRELRLAAFAAVAFGALEAALLPGLWPLMPFPQTAPVEIVVLIGLLFGFVLRRTWVLALPLVTLVAINPPGAGFAGSLIALMILSPFAAGGAFLGISAGRWLRRRTLRRTLRKARVPARVQPVEAEHEPIHASRGGRLPVAGAGR